ncbi:hypothetical protein [Nocardia sp. NPDC057668]|uniref:hypothetical protein n=1 Tax=Nocardia sp. NPDC057668 TaxID=3346202 RepID=UPI00366E9ABE
MRIRDVAAGAVAAVGLALSVLSTAPPVEPAGSHDHGIVCAVLSVAHIAPASCADRG